MILPLEPLFYPCCAPVVLHTFLSQYGVQVFTQPLLRLGSGSLSAAIGLNKQPPALTPDSNPLNK